MLFLDNGLTKHAYIEKSSIHAVNCAIAGEILGETLKHYDNPSRIKAINYIDKDTRPYFPAHLLDEKLTCCASFISESLYRTFELLSSYKPESDDSMFKKFSSAFYTQSDLFSKAYRSDKFSIGSALALGAYASLTCGVLGNAFENIGVLMFRIISRTSEIQGSRNVSAYMTLAYLFAKLIKEGYYSRETACDAVDADMCFGSMAASLLGLEDFWGDQYALYKYADAQIHLTYLEKIIIRVCAALTHIDYTAKLNPKSQMGWISTGIGEDCADSLTIYCALASASEYSFGNMFTSSMVDTYGKVRILNAMINRIAF